MTERDKRVIMRAGHMLCHATVDGVSGKRRYKRAKQLRVEEAAEVGLTPSQMAHRFESLFSPSVEDEPDATRVSLD